MSDPTDRKFLLDYALFAALVILLVVLVALRIQLRSP